MLANYFPAASLSTVCCPTAERHTATYHCTGADHRGHFFCYIRADVCFLHESWPNYGSDATVGNITPSTPLPLSSWGPAWRQIIRLCSPGACLTLQVSAISQSNWISCLKIREIWSKQFFFCRTWLPSLYACFYPFLNMHCLHLCDPKPRSYKISLLVFSAQMPLNARCSHIYASALDCMPVCSSVTPKGSRVLQAPASHHRFGDSWHTCDVPVMTAVAQVPAQQRMALPLVFLLIAFIF